MTIAVLPAFRPPSLDRGMLDAIDRAASERSLTRSAFLADAARNEIEMRR